MERYALPIPAYCTRIDVSVLTGWKQISLDQIREFFCNVFIFDVVLFTLHAQVLLTDSRGNRFASTFFDNEYLVCTSKNHILYLVNARNGDILTYLDCGFVPSPLCVCRQRSIICVSRDRTENVELVKVRLPRTS